MPRARKHVAPRPASVRPAGGRAPRARLPRPCGQERRNATDLATLPRGCLPSPPPPQVVCCYPEDAREISWHNGQPVQRPYRGPRQLRFEQEFSDGHHVRLAITAWARAHFEVLHAGFAVDPDWAAASLEAEAAEAAAAAAAAVAAGAAAHLAAQVPQAQQPQPVHAAPAAAEQAELAHDALLPLMTAVHVQPQQPAVLPFNPDHAQPPPGPDSFATVVAAAVAAAAAAAAAAGSAPGLALPTVPSPSAVQHPQLQQALVPVPPQLAHITVQAVPATVGAAPLAPSSVPLLHGHEDGAASMFQLPDAPYASLSKAVPTASTASSTCPSPSMVYRPQHNPRRRGGSSSQRHRPVRVLADLQPPTPPPPQLPQELCRSQSACSLLSADDSADYTLDGKQLPMPELVLPHAEQQQQQPPQQQQEQHALQPHCGTIP